MTAENDINFAWLVLGGEAVHTADQAVIVWCPPHLRKQSPYFACAKKMQKITEYCDTA